MSKELPKCKYKQDAGSYYDPLPWSVCSKEPQDNAGILTGRWPMCAYDAEETCDYYEDLCKEEVME